MCMLCPLLLLLVIAAASSSYAQDNCECNRPTIRSALTLFYRTTGGEHWRNSTGWQHPTLALCAWYGFRCNSLTLSGNNLSGQLPEDVWVNLTDLKVLDLSNNTLRGTLPPQLGLLAKLATVLLEGNNFSGSLPEAYSNWSGVRIVDVSNNYLNGTLPPQYSDWRHITEFDVRNNSFNGSLPPEYLAWQQIKDFWADSNQLSGTLPAAYRSWSHVQRFSIRQNRIDGTLPLQYSAWTSIEEFLLSDNLISGSLVADYSAWPMLQEFWVDQNRLHGELPHQYCLWGSRIREFVVFGNNFSGTLSACYSNWTSVELFYVHSNHLTGTLPPEYSAWRRLTDFSVSGNELRSTLPLEYGDSFLRLENFLAGYNRLSGTVPWTYVNMIRLRVLSLQANRLVGTMPAIIANRTLLVDNNPMLTLPLYHDAHEPLLVASVCNMSSESCKRTPAALVYICQEIDASRPITWDILIPVPRPTCAPPLIPTPPAAVESNSIRGDRTAPSFAASSVLSALAGSSTAALAAQRLALRVKCPSNEPPSLDGALAPLHLSLGASTAAVAAHVGAVVGNLLLVLASIATAVVALLWRCRCSATTRPSSSVSQRGWSDYFAAASALRLPGALTVVVSYVYQQIVVSSVVCLTALPQTGSVGRQIAAGVVGVTCSCSWVGFLLKTLVHGFAATASASLLDVDRYDLPWWKSGLLRQRCSGQVAIACSYPPMVCCSLVVMRGVNGG